MGSVSGRTLGAAQKPRLFHKPAMFMGYPGCMSNQLHNMSPHKRLFELIRQQEVATLALSTAQQSERPATIDTWDRFKEQALRSFQSSDPRWT
jgi:hypothetical protein